MWRYRGGMRDFVWNGGLLRIDHLNCFCESQNTSRSTIGRMISDLSRCLSMAYFKRIYNILTYILTVYETSHWRSTRLSMTRIIKLEQSWIKVVWKLDIVVRWIPSLAKIQRLWLVLSIWYQNFRCERLLVISTQAWACSLLKLSGQKDRASAGSAPLWLQRPRFFAKNKYQKDLACLNV